MASRDDAVYDVIVIGLGAMGSAAAYHLARRGARVLGLDAHAPGHTLGSSHGESRIIRLSYYEHPDYVPLLLRAYELWDILQQEAEVELLRMTGGLYVGPLSGSLVAGSLRSAQEHRLPVEVLDAPEIVRRFPVLRPRVDDFAVYEPRAGVLFCERCIEAHLRLAAAAGARLRHEEPVHEWHAGHEEHNGGGPVEVRTGAAVYRATDLVITAGAWAGRLLAPLGIPLQPERNTVFWLQPQHSAGDFASDRFPIWIWDAREGGVFYGVPHLERDGVKVARHHSGIACDPDTVSRVVTAADEAPVRRFVQSAIPALDGPVADSVACLYTLTPDQHFVIDRHPEHPNVIFACGFSGHGFKFSSVVGEILADLATGRPATPAADFLRLARLVPSQ